MYVGASLCSSKENIAPSGQRHFQSTELHHGSYKIAVRASMCFLENVIKSGTPVNLLAKETTKMLTVTIEELQPSMKD